MKQYNYQPNKETKDMAIIYQIIIIVMMIIIIGFVSWIGGMEYSRHACMVTTGDEQCNQQSSN
jgi:flagellar basal body-associated protein FliL